MHSASDTSVDIVVKMRRHSLAVMRVAGWLVRVAPERHRCAVYWLIVTACGAAPRIVRVGGTR